MNNYALIRYKVPLLGEWVLTESFDVLRNNEKTTSVKSVPEGKKVIREDIFAFRETEIKKREAEINALRNISGSAESYRVKF